ncbi:DCC1-like thiol-disulfide oxidoreductase family protein [Gymnodinialimonas sp. 2305UL16-5]|uniref:thiol-disulfide oxidoreductase DCC family protein n=1 Tax=Gymnodinialimonas mytili TaxID=3126503 RepID=UPI0030A98EB9
MPRLDDLPPSLHAQLTGRDLIVFDGECVLCSGFFRLMVRLDRDKRFSFAHAQSDLGTSLYTALNLPVDEFETNLILIDGVIYTGIDSFAAAMRAVGWPWRALAFLRYLPPAVKRPLYARIARNRYALFGRYDTCMMPDADLLERFIDRPVRAA